MPYATAQLGETLRFCKDLRSHYGCVVDPVSSRNDFHGCLPGGKDGRYLRLTTLPSSRADCLENLRSLSLLESSSPVQAQTGLYLCPSPLKSQRSKISSRLWLHYRPLELHITSRTELIWVITQQIVVIPFRSFGTTYRSHLQGNRIKK